MRFFYASLTLLELEMRIAKARKPGVVKNSELKAYNNLRGWANTRPFNLILYSRENRHHFLPHLPKLSQHLF